MSDTYGYESMADYPKLTFKYGWEDRDEEETPMKGYRSNEIVQTQKEIYSVYFIDPVRLRQDLEAESELRNAFLAKSGLILLPEVNREAMENAVRKLWEKEHNASYTNFTTEPSRTITHSR